MNNLRTFLSISIIVLIFGSCQKDSKEGVDTKTQSNTNHGQSYFRLSLPDSSAELLRVYNDVKDNDYEIAIIDNTMFGNYNTDQANNIMISGRTEPSDNISIVLNNNTYSARANGQWLAANINFKNYIGTNVSVQIKSGGTTISTSTIYVPNAALATTLIESSEGDPCVVGQTIERTGNTLTWTPDTANTIGYLLLSYQLSDSLGHNLLTDAEIIANDGSYNIDGLLTNSSARRISFELISANTSSAMTSNSKKILLYIGTWDHHIYYIAP